MIRRAILPAILSLAFVAASCGAQSTGETAARAQSTPHGGAEAGRPFTVAALGTFDEPWALAIEPGMGRVFVTEKAGTLKLFDPATRRIATVGGAPEVSYGGQGGFADVAFAPDYAASHALYLSWVKADSAGRRYGVIGRGTLRCAGADTCRVEGLKEIWRQRPALDTFGQFALRIAFSPDGKYMFVSSGDLVKATPAQDLSNNLGKILRLLPDGSAAPGNPFAGKGSAADQIWTLGHRNPLGLAFDPGGQLWDLEHGPDGGDELNRLVAGDNYGWPIVSNGDNYDGTPIPRHSTRPDFHAPAVSWNPVIAPGGMIFYSGKLWPQWRGQALIAGLKSEALVRVSLDGDRGKEEARYDMGKRMRGIAEAPDGAIYMIEDGERGRLLELRPD
jgi:glucose/arabinose dehydrogenase